MTTTLGPRSLLLAASAAAAALSALPARGDRDSLARRLDWPRREARVEAEVDLPREEAERLLSHPSRWVRSGAAAALERIAARDSIGALTEALSTERDPLAREKIAAALAATGKEARDDVRAACDRLGRSAGPGVFDAYVRAVVERELRRVIDEITDSTGNVKGFFAKPFGDIADIASDAVPVLVEFVRGGRTSALGRQVAVRGLAELGDSRAAAPLREVFDGLSAFMAREGIEEALVPELGEPARDEVELRRYVSHALYRLEDREPFERRVRAFLAQLRDITSPLGSLRRSSLEDIRGHYALGYEYHQVRRYDDAIAFYIQAKSSRGFRRFGAVIVWDYLASYNMACIESQRGNVPLAITHLAEAIDAGFADMDWIGRDHDLDPLRGDPRFEALIESPLEPRPR